MIEDYETMAERELSAELDDVRAERDELRAKLSEGQKYRAELAGRICRLEEERDRLQAVVRKLVRELGVEVKGDWLTYCYDEFSGPLPFDADELAAYQRALTETTDG